MTTATLGGTLRKVFDRVRDAADHGDGELLSRYRAGRDQEAFGSLVRRHGPMVLGVCQRVLRDSHAADDAFQATFLVLAKKADSVRPPDRLAPWLYGVAYRTALKARGRAFRRQQVEQDYAANPAKPQAASGESSDLLPIIDEQLNALPEKYRDALFLCGVQGLNKAEAAAKLGLPEGTVSSRLARAREMLRDRLARRGVVVPATAFATLFTADTLQAAVPAALLTTTTGVSAGSTAIPATVLTLSSEVIRSMTLLKLKFLGAIALSVSLVGGGFGLVALKADEKKPAVEKPGEKPAVKPGEKPGEKPAVKPGEKPVAKPDGEKPKPAPDGEKKPVKPDGEKKPVKPGAQVVGKVSGVDAKENTITLSVKGDGGLVDKAIKLNANTKVFIDGKEGKLADVPKGAMAAFVATPSTKDGVPPDVSEVRITGASFGGVVKTVDASSISLDSEKNPQSFKLAQGGKVTVDGKDAKLTDIKAGDKVMITLSADGKDALAVASGTKAAGDKPTKPGAAPKFGGKVSSVDANAKTISVTGKGDNEIVVKLTADAKISIDGKEGKLADIKKGVLATFTIVSAKDGQLREANEVTVAGPTVNGVIKQIDKTSITVGTEKTDRVIKLTDTVKVMVADKESKTGEKEGKIGDLKVGDRVSVSMTSDETGATLIKPAATKPTGDKPKPEKGGSEEDE